VKAPLRGLPATTSVRGYQRHWSPRAWAATSPVTWDRPSTLAVARSASDEASLLRSSPWATLHLACGPCKKSVRGGSLVPVIPVELVPKLAGGDSLPNPAVHRRSKFVRDLRLGWLAAREYRAAIVIGRPPWTASPPC